jgi:hypothetical protein
MGLAKVLIAIGSVLAAAVLVWLSAGRMGMGHLPGDFVIGRGHFRLYLPLTSSLMISAVLTFIFWLSGRM